MNSIRKLWKEQPLTLVMFFAIASRLLAVFFAKGYGMHDDHFLVMEWAQNWLLNGEQIDKSRPAGHSLIYPGLHYMLLYFFQKIGFYKPDFIMYVVRFLHALISLVTVYFGFKVVELRTNKKIAAEAGLILAILWLFPFMSVRNLIEMVCIPFAMVAAYFMMKFDISKKISFTFWAGVFLGLAFMFRYQTNLFAVGFVLVLVSRRKLFGAFLLSIGFVCSSFLIQGLIDWIVYGYPYASFVSYYLDNSANSMNYTTGAWYVYIGTILGVLIPPTSVLLFIGFFKQWRKWAILFWPTFIFLVFHSLFPNKQERFILPAIPFFVMISIVGWREYVVSSKFWQRHSRLHSGLWKWFWAVNTILLIIVSTTYSKRARVEIMNYLHSKNDVKAILVETSDGSAPPLPQYYLGKRVPIYYFTKDMSIDSIKSIIQNGVEPNYLIMMNEKKMKERYLRLDKVFPNREKITEISPSLMDQVLYKLNPKHNVNQQCYIYRIEQNKISPVDSLNNK